MSWQLGDWFLVLVSLGGAFALTGFARLYAVGSGLVDVPNLRSSHTESTPRGGGIAVVTVLVPGLCWWGWSGGIVLEAVVALGGAGVLVAFVGWIDDHRDLPARWRILAHFLAAAWGLFWLDGLPPLPFFVGSVDFGWIGHGLALLYLVWLLNLYNFMDGIDGIAGIEAVTVCIGGVVLYALVVGWVPEVHGLLLLAAAVLGFLVWNFPKARIFMGDVGSGFIGVMLGLLSIQAAWVAPELFWAWVILLGAFVVDATLTLIRRVWRGEKFYEAHRSHAYQYAARLFGHVPVSLAFAGINVFWLLPIAALVAIGLLEGFVGVIIAYGALVALGYRFNAGARELQEV